ncbi:hypothetical protein HKBW3S25_01395 [Candidatus Hakubella thermalkaliphila]|uniref:Uncharacterized protein n=1 Tax=Candidatus Hakubella thermalkaliphila TaxID=2754717 RepID=A0A6V8P767_9ACTN|nr:hypothetical protein HKBW3S25_01395 [Candidatus Hakubella thermalkaliphila]GFP28197.1 hypothetical protein HKBW3S33_01613 [Candidatus Hakubella thermalkaliphila]
MFSTLSILGNQMSTPFLEVPGHSSQDHVDAVTLKALVAAAIHPMVRLEMADHCLDSSPFSLSGFKPIGLAIRMRSFTVSFQ